MDDKYQLGVVDYIVICIMLALSASTGIYQALFSSGRQKTTHEYLLGNRQLGAIPVGISVFISIISAITFIGTPAEVYRNGPTFWLVTPSIFVVGMIISRTFIPVFYRLEVTSIYEYLDLRFNKVVRLTTAAISVVTGFIYMAFVIYAPALAISSVTSVSIDLAIIVMGLVCTFYSSIGGIKAVIWADVIQASIMVVGMFVLLVVGLVNVGGVHVVVERLVEGNRDEFVVFDPDPTIRHSFLAIMVGGIFQSVYTNGVNQLAVQRYLCCKSEQGAVASTWLGISAVALTRLLAVAIGLVIFAFYASCDPLDAGRIEDRDQIVGLYIVDLLGGVPGLSGLILASIFSATLSTVSSGVNAVAANISEDLIKPHFKYSEGCLTLTTKTIAAACGVLATGLAKGVPLLGDSLLEGALGFVGVLSGPVLGVFSLGMFFPYSNSKGAMTGLVFGALLGYFFLVGSFLLPLPLTDQLPYINDDCPVTNFTMSFGAEVPTVTATFAGTMTTAVADAMPTSTSLPMSPSNACLDGTLPDWFCKLCNVSYMYYGCFTCLLTMLVGVVVSFLTGPMDPRSMDPALFCRLPEAFCCCLPRRCTGWFCSSVGSKHEPKESHENLGYEPDSNGHLGDTAGLVLNDKTIDTRL